MYRKIMLFFYFKQINIKYFNHIEHKAYAE